MVGYILKKSFEVLAKKPVMLWGVSIMCALISYLVIIGGLLVPIITVPFVLTLTAGMSALYLDGYNGRPVDSKQLFKGFTKECVPRVTGGMCWYYLWSLIWAFVPVVGIIKAYSYRFTPYILITRPDIGAIDALKLSMMETKGYKLKMFLTDLLIAVVIAVVVGVFAAMTQIPHAGFVFGIISGLISVALSLFLPLFYGIVGAAFYQEINNSTFTAAVYTPARYNPSPLNTPKDWYCSECGTQNPGGTLYCRACGKKNGE